MKQNNNWLRKIFVKVLGNEKCQFITIPVFSILFGFIVGAIVILILGKNPLEAYGNLLQGSGLWMKEKYAGGRSMLTDFFSHFKSEAQASLFWCKQPFERISHHRHPLNSHSSVKPPTSFPCMSRAYTHCCFYKHHRIYLCSLCILNQELHIPYVSGI